MQVLQIFLNTAPNEYNLLELLVDINDQWYVIGKALRVANDVLNGLQKSPEDNKFKLIQVINTWLASQSSPVTWKTVISTLEGKLVNNLAKANEICDHLGLSRRQ